MTKSEVRTVTLGKLMIRPDDVVVDVGAGTGSVTVACAMEARHVYSVECKEEACELIKENVENFNLQNVTLLQGMAPDVMNDIPLVDRIFCGGTRGNMAAILDWADAHLKPQGIVVGNFVTQENATDFIRTLKAHGYINLDIVRMAISKGKPVGSVTMMEAYNPITIIKGVRP